MSDGNWIDPWYELREITAQRNQVKEVAHRYSRMHQIAVMQYKDMVEAGAKQDTLDGLSFILNFTQQKADSLWPVVARLEREIEQKTEKLNNA